MSSQSTTNYSSLQQLFVSQQKKQTQIKLVEPEFRTMVSKKLNQLIKTSPLVGEYQVYTIYERQGKRYALIHSFYYPDKVQLEEMPECSLSDGRYLHNRLRQSTLRFHLDYLFIIVYYEGKGAQNLTLESIVTEYF